MDNHIKDNEQLRLAESLDKIKLPEVRTPVCKQKLKSALIDHARTLRQPSGFNARRDRRFALRRSLAFALPAAAILLLVALWQLVIPAPQTYAHIVLEVNPSVRLMIDENYNLSGLEALDPEADRIFKNMDLRNTSSQKAVTEIVNRLYRQGLLTPERRMFLVIYPVADVSQEYLAAALNAVHEAANRRILELNLEIAVSRFVMDAQSYKAAEQAELRPSQYSRLLEAGLSPEMQAALFKAGEELGLDRKVFSARFAVAAELVAEMLEAGLSEKEAMKIVRELFAAGAGVGLMEDAVENLLERIDDGEKPSRALNRIRRAIKSGRLSELKSKDDDDDDDRNKTADQDDEDNDENADTDQGDNDNRTDGRDDKDDRDDYNDKPYRDDQIDGEDGHPGNREDYANQETDETGEPGTPDD